MTVPAKRTLPEDIIVGRNIRSIRESRGLSQQTVGDACGITFQQQQKIENGKNRVPAGRIVLLTKVLQCTLADIYAGTDAADGPASTVTMPSPPAIRLAFMFDAIPDPSQRTHISGLVKSLSTARKEHADA